MQFIEFLVGPFGAAFGFIIPIAGLVLSIGLAAVNILVGLNDGARRLGSILTIVMIAGSPIWMAAFYGSSLFVADFDGDWRAIAFVSVLAAGSVWLAGTALYGVVRVLRQPTHLAD